MTSQLMSQKDIARTYGLDAKTVRSYVRAGILKPIPKPTSVKRDRFSREAVEKVFGRIYGE